MKIYLKVLSSGLVPMYDSDFDEKKKLKIGTMVVADIKQPRNYEHHKKFFALLRMVVDNMPEELQERYPNTDTLLTEIKYQLRHFQTHITLSGRETYIPKSISFDSMTQDEFNDFYNGAIDVVLRWFLPRNNKEELLEAVNDYL